MPRAAREPCVVMDGALVARVSEGDGGWAVWLRRNLRAASCSCR